MSAEVHSAEEGTAQPEQATRSSDEQRPDVPGAPSAHGRPVPIDLPNSPVPNGGRHIMTAFFLLRKSM